MRGGLQEEEEEEEDEEEDEEEERWIGITQRKRYKNIYSTKHNCKLTICINTYRVSVK